jgi:hypothetical protein
MCRYTETEFISLKSTAKEAVLPIYSNMVESRRKMWSLCMRSRCSKVSPTYMAKVSSIVMLNLIVRHSRKRTEKS